MQKQTHAGEIACSLNDEEFRQRRAMLRKSLLPQVLEATKIASGLRLCFAETKSIRASVEAFVTLERECCGFLTFTITPPGKGLKLTVEGPPEAQATLERMIETVLERTVEPITAESS